MQALREFYDGAKGEEEKLNELYREMVGGLTNSHTSVRNRHMIGKACWFCCSGCNHVWSKVHVRIACRFYRKFYSLSPPRLSIRLVLLQRVEMVEGTISQSKACTALWLRMITRAKVEDTEGEKDILLCVVQDKSSDAVVRYFGEDPARKPFEEGKKRRVHSDSAIGNWPYSPLFPW
jgi:hypothetical protein